MRWLMLLVLACTLLVLPGSLQACPLCAEAIANSSDGPDDTSNFPTAMNQSIYLMVSVPYITLAVVGFLIYRGCKKNAEYLAALERATQPVTQGEPGA